MDAEITAAYEQSIKATKELKAILHHLTNVLNKKI
jgi:hypothetical protein